MTRSKDIIDSIFGELNYQDEMSIDRDEIRIDLTEGECLLAIKHLVDSAIPLWYSGSHPHMEVRHAVRKIAALCVRMCEDEHGMPKRK